MCFANFQFVSKHSRLLLLLNVLLFVFNFVGTCGIPRERLVEMSNALYLYLKSNKQFYYEDNIFRDSKYI